MSIQYQKVEWYDIAKVESGYYLRFSIEMGNYKRLYFNGYTDRDFNILKIANMEYTDGSGEEKVEGSPLISDIVDFIIKQRIQILFEWNAKVGYLSKGQIYRLNERYHRYDGECLVPLTNEEIEEMKREEEEYYVKRREIHQKYNRMAEKEMDALGLKSPKEKKNFAYLKDEEMYAVEAPTGGI